MEHKVRVLEPEQLMEPLLALLEEEAVVPLVITGSSMTPFLVHDRDTVYLTKASHPLKRGDMALYRRDNGAWILHRVYRAEKDSYTMVGDAQTMLEPDIRPDQVKAVVSAVRRKGKLLKKGSFWWDFFEILWIRMVPLRPGIWAVYSWVKRVTK